MTEKTKVNPKLSPLDPTVPVVEDTTVEEERAAPEAEGEPELTRFSGPVMNVNTSRDLFDQVFNKLTRSGQDALRPGATIIRRRRLSFIVDGSACAPNVFCDDVGEYYDFKLTVQTLDSTEEMNALNSVSDAGQVPMLLAKACLYAINDKPLPQDRDKRDFLWEALGMQGRQLVMLAVNSLGSASAAALGKYQATVTVA